MSNTETTALLTRTNYRPLYVGRVPGFMRPIAEFAVYAAGQVRLSSGWTMPVSYRTRYAMTTLYTAGR